MVQKKINNADIDFILSMIEAKIREFESASPIIPKELFEAIKIKWALLNIGILSAEKMQKISETFIEKDEHGNPIEDMSDKIMSIDKNTENKPKRYKFKNGYEEAINKHIAEKQSVAFPDIDIVEWSKLNWKNDFNSQKLFSLIT